jgi:hypothetical protein
VQDEVAEPRAEEQAEDIGEDVEVKGKRVLPLPLRELSKKMRDSYALACNVGTGHGEQAMAQVDGNLWQRLQTQRCAICKSWESMSVLLTGGINGCGRFALLP